MPQLRSRCWFGLLAAVPRSGIGRRTLLVWNETTERPAARRTAASPRAGASRDEGPRRALAQSAETGRPQAPQQSADPDDTERGSRSEDLLAAAIGVRVAPGFNPRGHSEGSSSETRFALNAGPLATVDRPGLRRSTDRPSHQR
jgi:hypothetical protein